MIVNNLTLRIECDHCLDGLEITISDNDVKVIGLNEAIKKAIEKVGWSVYDYESPDNIRLAKHYCSEGCKTLGLIDYD